MSRLIFTITDQPDHPGAERLRRSARYWGWDLKWFTPGEIDQFFKWQSRAQVEILAGEKPDSFIYVDAWDTIFCGPPQELKLRDKELCFCGDTLLAEWQNKSMVIKMSPDVFPTIGIDEFRYVNDGVMWGDPKILLELWDDYLANYPWVLNQDYMNQRYAFETSMKRYRLRVDGKAQVALNLMGMLMRQVDKTPSDRLIYRPFRSTPLVVHSPGTRTMEAIAPIPRWMEEAFCHEP